ncbi:hypothetical protein ACFOET_05500 [Parapedobacter deserti]|uniref:Uncharacterized protein n=1 Tax=Parapedobacter deserti TaxID=1912957 RepID=A0ABV7JLY5_9SPHI
MEKSNKSVANRAKMVKVLLKTTGVILFLMVALLVWFDQSRSFYCLSENKCVTVWKRLGNKCYIVPGKYYGIFKPSDNYIKTTNTGYVDVIFLNDISLLVDIEDNAKIIRHPGKNLIELYSNNKAVNDSLYTYFDGKYHKYKNEVEYISIDIKENYAINKAGRKLR